MKSLSKYDDLEGNAYGRLTVLSLAYVKSGIRYYFAECACDKTILIRADSLVTGNTRSCGCYNLEVARELIKARSVTHGDSKTRLYNIWLGMRRRCYDQNTKAYSNYGGRGVSVCDQWLDYETFKEWSLNNGYSDLLSIDRIDNNGNYSPENCRWADHKTQANNKSCNIKVVFNGEEGCLADISEKSGIKHKTLYCRIRNNIDMSQLFESKIKRSNAVTVSINGKEESIKSISQKTGLTRSTIESRIRAGVEGEELLLANQFPYRYLTIEGETKTVAEWSRFSGVPRTTILGRLERGIVGDLLLYRGRIKRSNRKG